MIEIEGISKEFKTGELIEVNVPEAEITNLSTNKKFRGKKFNPILLNILKNGGLEKQLLAELKAQGKG